MRKFILDIPIDWINPDEIEETFLHFVASRKRHQITTVNPEFVVLSQENRRFKSVLKESDLSLPDGTGIILAQQYQESNPPKQSALGLLRFLQLGITYLISPYRSKYKRITGVDLTYFLLTLSQREGWKIFLLGAQPGVAERAAAVWVADYPGLDIVGISSANPDNPSIVKEIVETKPDVLLVAYGAPKQELFIADHATTLNVPIMVGVGGTFDYAARVIHRPPVFIRAFGLEWLARLIQQPKRIKRIYHSTVVFVWQIIHARKK